MDFSSTLSPELQQFLWSAAAEAAGGLAVEFTVALLRMAGRRVAERFSAPAQHKALERAAGAAIANTVADWQLATDDYRDLWMRYEDWLLEPAVLREFHILVTPTEDGMLDMELLQDELEAAGLDVKQLPQADFDTVVQDMISGFYAAAANEPDLQEPLKIRLLYQLAERTGALERLAKQQVLLERRSLSQLEQLNLVADQVADGQLQTIDLLQEILHALQATQTDPLSQQVIYEVTMRTLSRADIYDVDIDSVGLPTIGDSAQVEILPDLNRISALLEEIRDSLTSTRVVLSEDDLRKMEHHYRQSLIDQFEILTFKGISPSGRAIALPLEKVYVELKAVADVPEAADTYSVEERRLLLEAEEKGEFDRAEIVSQLDALRLERWRAEAHGQSDQTGCSAARLVRS
jgi:hypothetical protein